MIKTAQARRQFQYSRSVETASLSLLLASAAILRVYRLSYQSLWADEGNSWRMAMRSLAEIGPAAAGDIHPPLYYYLLNLWARLFGTSEAGLRSLSAACGVLLVLVTYLWARRLAGRSAALLAGLLATISPFAIYYSQEARGYALLATLAATSSFLFTLHVTNSRGQLPALAPLVGYVVVSAATLWTHYLGFLLLALQNLLALIWLITERQRDGFLRRLLTWVTAQAVIVLAYLPWLCTMLDRASAWPAISEQAGLRFYLKEMVRLYTVGPSSNSLTVVAWLAVAPAVAAMVPLRHERSRWLAWTTVISHAIWPALTMFAMALIRPAYRPKFMLVGLPAYHIVAGAGIVLLARWVRRLSRKTALGLVAGTLLLVPTAATSYRGLDSYYHEPTSARDDYRSLARLLEAAAAPQDAIILNAPGQIEVFSYYYSGNATLYPLPLERPPHQENVWRQLERLSARHSRVFAVFWATAESDPYNYVENWLDTHAYKGLDTWYGTVRLASYEIPQNPLEVQESDALFGGSIRLLRYGTLAAQPVAPGTALPIEFHWTATEQVGQRYKVFIQALDAHSNIVGQRDGEPVAGHSPTNTWKPGATIIDREALPISLGTPPGNYTVIAGLYDATSGSRLLLPDGSDHLVLGKVSVSRAPRPVNPQALRPTVLQQISFGPVRLLGWDCGPLGGTPAHSLNVKIGQPLSIVLYWRVLQQESVHLAFLLEGHGTSTTLAEHELLQGIFPPDQWQANQVLRDPHIIFMPGNLSPGPYMLSVVIETPSGSGRIDVAKVKVS